MRLLQVIETATARDKEVAGQLSDDIKIKLRRSVFESVHGGHDGVVFDTSRLWTAKLPILAMLFPNAKVICCVRDISWIMDSWERLYARNPLELSAAFGFKADTTVYSRVSKLASSDGIVGHALDALREGFYGPWRDRLLLIDYLDLARHPGKTITRIYDFIREPEFEHGFDFVEFSADSYDASLGMPGLHTVSGPVRFTPRETVLPPDLFDRFKNDSFWKKGTEQPRLRAM